MDDKFTGPPVEIVKSQRRHFPGAHPQPQQHQHHCVIPALLRLPPVERAQQHRHITLGKALG
jgi:hypothetical protein